MVEDLTSSRTNKILRPSASTSLSPLKSFCISLTMSSSSLTWVTATASSLVTLIEGHPSIRSAYYIWSDVSKM